MAIFMDSFQYTLEQLEQKWNVITLQTNLSASGIESSSGPYGGRVLRLATNALNGSSRIRKTIGNSNIFSTAFGLKKVLGSVEDRSLTVAGLFNAGTEQLSLRFSSGEKLGLYRGTTLLVEVDHMFARGNWYHIRWKATISNSCPENSNQLQVIGPNVNEIVTVPTSTVTRVVAEDSASILELGCVLSATGSGSTNREHHFSDLYCSNEEAVLLPNLRVHPLRPTANGATMQWTPNTGTAWEATDDLTPDDDTTKISTDTDGHIALFEHAGLPTPAESVKAVQMAAWAKKDDAFDVNLEPTYRIGVDNFFVGKSAVGNAYAAVHSATSQDPNATDVWTEGVVNAMQIGVRVEHA
jgi:hypothetical protein